MDTKFLRQLAADVRGDIITVAKEANGAHVGSSLSCVELLTYLYFERLDVTCDNLQSPTRDRLVLSKGHAGLTLACVGVKKGFIRKEELKSFNKCGSSLSIHLDESKLPFVDVSTGSLGHGEGVGLGMAIGYKKLGVNSKIYTILGDGEMTEGSVYEALLSAVKFNATNLVTVIDDNGYMLDGKTAEITSGTPLKDRLAALGFEVVVCDGHDFEDIDRAFKRADEVEKPCVIIAKTVKGKGVSFMENDPDWHYRGLTDEEYALAIEQLK